MKMKFKMKTGAEFATEFNGTCFALGNMKWVAFVDKTSKKSVVLFTHAISSIEFDEEYSEIRDNMLIFKEGEKNVG